MVILAIDFSTERRAVCVTDQAARTGVAIVEDRRAGALSLVERALEAAGIQRSELSRIAVGLGPGSYTGIRSAIALAQGWQLATGVELVGVSSVEVMAHSVGLHGEFEIMVDAQRGEFHRAVYQRDESGLRLVKALEIVAPGELIGTAVRFCPTPEKFAGVSEAVFPSAEILARLASEADPVAGETLAPIYLRAAEFKKAPPSRELS